MSKLRTFSVLASVVTVAVGSGQSRQVNTATIIGQITMLPISEPVPRAKVSLYSIRHQPDGIVVHPVRTVTADENGRYRIDGLLPGWYLTEANLPGFKTSRAWDVLIGPGQPQVVDLGLNVGSFNGGRSYELSGNVTTPSGRPVPDATITVVQFEVPVPMHQTRTDDRGRYRAWFPHSGNYAIQARKVGLRPESRTLEIRADAKMSFVLSP